MAMDSAELALDPFDTAPDVGPQRLTEHTFRGLLEAAPDALVGVDERGVIVLANTRAERMFGYGCAELIGVPLRRLCPDAAQIRLRERRRNTSAVELIGRRSDGSEFPAEISLSTSETGDGVIVSAAIRDITSRKHIEQQLREKNAELKTASRAKDTFLASMSHELRTPLNAIIGFTGTLLMQLPGPLNDDQLRQLRTVEKSAKHLLAIINDILDLARIESGAVSLALEPVDCRAMVDDVTTTLRPLAEEKGLRLGVQVPETDVVVQADSRSLGQILINLVGNAIKFTERGSVEVIVSDGADNDEGVPTITVRDTGPGIAEADLAKIFKAFERAERAPVAREGTGLGLYISHKLAELIGAGVTVDTEPGVGSTFTVVLETAR